MAKSPTGAGVIGMVPKADDRPPFFPFAVSQYKSDLLVRSLADLAMAGLIVLAFAGGLSAAWQPVKSAWNSLWTVMSQPSSAVTSDGPAVFTARDVGPGRETILAVQAPQISDAVINNAAPASAGALKQAREYLKRQDPQSALAILASADPADPSILFGNAVATLHLGGNGRAIEAQRMLRGATAKAFVPAFTLNGLVLFQLLALHERGDLPVQERVTLDGAGRAIEVSPAQLASEAVQWWQRGAAFHDPEAMRLLGMAEARGFNGKRNLPAAIAYWRDAAARGDAIARFELAILYFAGIGVQADSEKAYELFRQAADQGVLRAALALGSALMSKGLTGDLETTREAVRLLDEAAKNSQVPSERAFAHFVIGVYLFEAAPPTLRDPARAVDHFRFAAKGGYAPAVKSLARAYETGIGVERNLVRSAGYLTLLRATQPRDVEAALARLSKALTAEELERVGKFRLSQDPASPPFRKQYEVQQSTPGLFSAVKSPTIRIRKKSPMPQSVQDSP
jgi:TPR repeat protein